jgi:chitodextrinase
MRALQVLAGMLLAAAIAAPASAASAGGVTTEQLTGILDVAYVDTLEHVEGKDTYAYQLRGRSRTTPVVLGQGEAVELAGSRVELTGKRVDGALRVAGTRHGQGIRVLERATPKKGAWAAETSGTNLVGSGGGAGSISTMAVGTARTLAVVLVNFSDKTTQPWTKARITEQVETGTASVKRFFEEEAKGGLTFDADVLGWYTIDATSTGCSSKWQTTYHDQATAKAEAAGVDLDAYTNVMYMWPALSDCGFAGVAYVGGKWSYINGTDSVQVLTHELGHNFGLGHANGLTCTSGGGEVMIAAPADCTVDYYADPFSTMGNNALRHNTGMGLVDMGLLATSERVVGGPGNTYTIAPYFASAGVKLVRVPRGDGTYFDLDIRSPYGTFDTYSAGSPVTVGVTIRIAVVTSSTGTPRQSRLLDATPTSSSGLADAALAVGRTMTDPVSQISFTVLSVGADGVTVRVREGIAPSAPASLSAELTTGGAVRLTWTAATDNTAIASYRVSRNGTQLAAPNGDASAYTDDTVAGGTSYTYAVTALDTSGNVGPAATIVVTTPGETPPPDPSASPTPTPDPGTGDAVAPGAPENVFGSATVTKVSLSWDEAVDDVGVTGYNVTRNGVLVASTSGLSWTDPGRTPATAYAYTVAARDAAGNVGAAVPVEIRTPADTVAPTRPRYFHRVARSGRYVTFDWAPSSDNVRVVKYLVYRVGRSKPVASTTNSRIRIVTVSGAYYYARAVDAAGNRSTASARSKGRP